MQPGSADQPIGSIAALATVAATPSSAVAVLELALPEADLIIAIRRRVSASDELSALVDGWEDLVADDLGTGEEAAT